MKWINLKNYYHELLFFGKITQEEFNLKIGKMKENEIEVKEPILVLTNGDEKALN